MRREPGVDRGTTGLRHGADPPVLLIADGDQGWKPLFGVRIAEDRNLDSAVLVAIETRMDDRVLHGGVATVGVAAGPVVPGTRKRWREVHRDVTLILFSSIRDAVAV